jgi:WbqC-like protein
MASRRALQRNELSGRFCRRLGPLGARAPARRGDTSRPRQLQAVRAPRRGWVHRCLVPSPAGADEWLTLPIATCPRETTIKDLRFAGDARASLDARLARYPWIASGQGKAAETVRAHLASPLEDVTTFLIAGLKLVCNVLGFSPTVTRSSSFGLDPLLRGEQRVIAAARAVGATRYVNAPGGRQLYDDRRFAEHGIELLFLSNYGGTHRHMLHALAHSDPGAIRADVLDHCELSP